MRRLHVCRYVGLCKQLVALGAAHLFVARLGGRCWRLVRGRLHGRLYIGKSGIGGHRTNTHVRRRHTSRHQSMALCTRRTMSGSAADALLARWTLDQAVVDIVRTRNYFRTIQKKRVVNLHSKASDNPLTRSLLRAWRNKSFHAKAFLKKSTCFLFLLYFFVFSNTRDGVVELIGASALQRELALGAFVFRLFGLFALLQRIVEIAQAAQQHENHADTNQSGDQQNSEPVDYHGTSETTTTRYLDVCRAKTR